MDPIERDLTDAWWRAANYLSAAQIYLMANPLLREPLLPEHIKPRLLGHWGTSPGLNFCYVLLNRVIKARDQDMIYVMGPGHGGPAAVANAWMEGSGMVAGYLALIELGKRFFYRTAPTPRPAARYRHLRRRAARFSTAAPARPAAR